MRCIVPPSFVICWDSQKLFESWIWPMSSSLPMLKISTGDVCCAWPLEVFVTRPLPSRGRGSIAARARCVPAGRGVVEHLKGWPGWRRPDYPQPESVWAVSDVEEQHDDGGPDDGGLQASRGLQDRAQPVSALWGDTPTGRGLDPRRRPDYGQPGRRPRPPARSLPRPWLRPGVDRLPTGAPG